MVHFHKWSGGRIISFCRYPGCGVIREGSRAREYAWLAVWLAAMALTVLQCVRLVYVRAGF